MEKENIMTAKEYFKELQSGRHFTNDVNDPYINGSVMIKPTGDRSGLYYVIREDGYAVSPSGEYYNVQMLRGDYELYSNIQYTKVGYVFLKDASSYAQYKTIFTNLFASITNDACIGRVDNVVPVYSEVHPTELDGFTYLDTSGIEVSVLSMPRYRKFNADRKLYGKRVCPFLTDDRLESKFCLVILIKQCMVANGDISLANAACKHLINKLTCDYTWVNLRMYAGVPD